MNNKLIDKKGDVANVIAEYIKENKITNFMIENEGNTSIPYLPYDEKILLKFADQMEQENASMMALLNTILTKCYSSMFYLNGGAAVATLAFLGTLMGRDIEKWNVVIDWIRWSLVWFSVGTVAVVLTAMASYISQSYFCESLDTAIYNSRLALQKGRNYSKGQIVDAEFKNNQPIIDRLKKRGNVTRIVAMIIAFISIVGFICGVCCFYSAFINMLDT